MEDKKVRDLFRYKASTCLFANSLDPDQAGQNQNVGPDLDTDGCYS